jgi:two-component system sensor histidine kinase HydH
MSFDGAFKDLLITPVRNRPCQPTPVDQLLQRTLVLLREEPAFRGVNVECEALTDDSMLEIDEMQIQQVLTNLLINAAHACQNGGSIRCRLLPAETPTRIVIEDDGIGMTSDTLVRAFEPFYTTKAKGTGLGLAICKRIVESHGGTISLESQPGRGTRVIIELPEKP